MLRWFLLLLCSALLPVPITGAAADADDVGYLELDTVVISGMRPIRGADEVATAQSSMFYSAVDVQEMRGKVTSVADAIADITGIQVRQSGGIGSYSSAYLRGAAPEQILVFLDGVPVNTAAGGGVDLSTITLAEIDVIEIFRGATPFEFSNSAVGGVINLRTHSAHQRDHSHASLTWGSFGARRLSGLWQASGAVDYLLSLDQLNSANDFNYRDDNNTQYNSDDDFATHRHNNDLEQRNALAKIGRSLAGDKRLDFIAQWLDKEQGFPNWNNSPAANTSFSTQRTNLQLKFLQGTDAHADTAQQAVRLHYKVEQELYDDRESQVGLGRQWNRYLTHGYGADIISKHVFQGQDIALQGNASYESYIDRDLLLNISNVSSTRRGTSLGAQFTRTGFEDSRISSALRWHQSNDQGALANGTQRRSQRDYVTGQAGVKAALGADWLLKSNIGRYAREPSFAELYSDRGLFTGNDELLPEYSINTDIGIQYRRHQQEIWELSLFYNRIQDAIVRIYDSRGIGHSENVAAARIAGVEQSLQWQALSSLKLGVHATWQQPENRSATTGGRTRQLPGRYTRAAGWNLDFQPGPVLWYARYQYEAGAYYDAQNLLPVKTRTILDSGIKWSTGPMQLIFAVNNIFGAHYEEFNSFPMPGRQYLLTLHYATESATTN